MSKGEVSGYSRGIDYNPNLVLYFSSEILNNSLLKDLSNYKNNGKIHGVSRIPNSILGYALYFNGIDNYIEILDNIILRFQSFTIMSWMNLVTNPGSSYAFFFQKDYAGFWAGSISIPIEWNLNSTFRIYTGVEESYTFTNLWKENWHHYTFRRIQSSGKIDVFRDGIFFGESIKSTDDILYDSGILKFPSRYDQGFKLEFDEYRIYNRSLTPEEIRIQYNILAERVHGRSI